MLVEISGFAELLPEILAEPIHLDFERLIIVIEVGGTNESAGCQNVTMLHYLFERRFATEPGDILVAYTDGVTEAKNDVDQPFGVERLGRIIRENCNSTARELSDVIYREVYKFSGNVPQNDDITLVVMKVKD